jgi:amino acid transporter
MVRKVDASQDIKQVLAADRLGVAAVLFFVMSAAAPLTIVAGVFPTAYAVTGNLGLPAAFFGLGVVLALFAVGYVTMSRHIPHTGAFYAYVSHGLGRTAGVSAAWVSLLTYNVLQISMYGGIGLGAQPLVKQYVGIELPWWVFALMVWALVAVLGVFRVDINGRVLAVLLVIEVALIVLFDLSFLLHPAHGFAVGMLSPTELLKPGVGAILAIAMLGFVGFESAVVFTEESRNPRRTIPVATYLAIAIIAVLYGISAWAMAVSAGQDKIVSVSQDGGPEALFNLAGTQLGSAAATLGHIFLLTSLIAAMISVHNTTARYIFALGRERVLPAFFGTTSPSGAPRAGSITQSALAVVTVLVYAVFHLDPTVQLFFVGGTLGGVGILVLLIATSVAVMFFFVRGRRGETAWHTVIAPVLALLGVSGSLLLVLKNFAGLIGVQETSWARWGLPAAYLVAALLGIAYGLWLKSARPRVHASVGMGAKTEDALHPGVPSFTHAAEPSGAALDFGR